MIVEVGVPDLLTAPKLAVDSLNVALAVGKFAPRLLLGTTNLSFSSIVLLTFRGPAPRVGVTGFNRGPNVAFLPNDEASKDRNDETEIGVMGRSMVSFVLVLAMPTVGPAELVMLTPRSCPEREIGVALCCPKIAVAWAMGFSIYPMV